jgi:hypothetical protein
VSFSFCAAPTGLVLCLTISHRSGFAFARLYAGLTSGRAYGAVIVSDPFIAENQKCVDHESTFFAPAKK